MKEGLVVHHPISGADGISPHSVERRVICLDVDSLPYGPGDHLCLPINYGKAFQIHCMSCGLAVLMNG